VSAGPVRIENITSEEQVPATVRVFERVWINGEAFVGR